MVVKVRVRFNQDGRLAEAPIIANQEYNSAFRAASKNAINAVRACEPFQLPSDKYEMWKDMVLNFDPRTQ